nr:integrase, catalytic region, zinc finger, CCHC-type, peptidase aspartic, catalytic [Tanacetum cinerariifolium]
MSTQQDIYAARSENRTPMLNKENYVPWSSHLLRYAKSRPNGKLIHNSIINGSYVRRMIPEPDDSNREIEADDQAIQTILLGLPEDIYAVVESCETAQEIWLRVQQMMKGSIIGIQEKNAKLFNEWERFTSNDGESIESYYHRFLKLMNDLKQNKHFPEKIASNFKFLNNLQPEWSRHVTIVHQTKDLHTADYTQLYDFLKYNQKENYMQQPMPNPEDITNLTTAMNMTLALMAKAFKLNYSTPTNNNQRISLNPRNRQIAQPSMNMGQDRQMQMNVGNQVIQHAVQNPRIQNVRNQNGLIGVPGNANRNPNVNGNLVAARAEEEFDLMAAALDLDEIKEVNANYILIENLQQASTSDTQTDKAPVYDSDGSAEVHNYEDCFDNEIFNMFTQEEQYTELLEPIPEPHQVPHNDNNVISEVSCVEQSGGTVEQHPANVEETRALYDSLYNNLAIEVEKINTVNHKLSETNAELTTELARYKNQERCFEIKFSDDTTPSVARKFLNEVKSTIVTLQHVVKQRMTLKTHNWSSSAHQEFHKIVKDEIFPTVIQVDARVQNFEIQFLKEAAKFVGDFKSLAKEANESLVQHKALKLEIKRLLRAVVSQDIMSVVQNNSVVDTINLQSELERTKERFENCIIKKENEYAKLWNDWEEKHVPNKVRASVRTKPITISQPPVITKKVVNYDSNGLSSTGVDNTKTRRPQPRSNTKNDRQCLNSVNHDVCLLNYVDSMSSRGKTQTKNVSINENQKKQKPKVKKTKKVWSIERLASPKPSKLRSFLRWSPIGRLFDLKGQFCDSNLEVAFRRNACFIRNIEGVDLLKGNRSTNLYTINLYEMASASPICLMAHASSTKSWLWHQRLSHLNSDTINDLAKKDL